MLVEVVLLGALLFLLWQVLKKPANLPPGRWGLPLVGYVPLPGPTVEDHLRHLSNKHGDIYLWRMGTQVMVFVHDYRLLRDALTRQEFTDRPDWDIYKFNEKEALGVVGSNKTIWHNNRRFSLRLLRDLGMGKSKLVEAVQKQATWLAGALSKQADKAAPVQHFLKVAVVNVLWQLIGGRQFDVDDPKLKEFEDVVKGLLDAESALAINDFLPWLRRVLPSSLLRRLTKQDVLETGLQRFHEFFAKEIDEHRATLSPGEPRDFIDGYLMEMENRKDDPEATCNETDMHMLLIDLFFAGSETTTSTLIWMFYYLAVNPRVQRKLQAEIDAVLPEGRLATLEDKPNLSYVEAVIHESLRKSSLASIGLQHVADKDTTLGKYFIPKGTVINGAAFTIHNDLRYWDNPDEFLPERWLDQDGKFVSKKEGFIPFGVGKRQCLGESLARMELLIFTATLLQRLFFAVPPGQTLSLLPDPQNPFLRIPRVQDLLISVRT